MRHLGSIQRTQEQSLLYLIGVLFGDGRLRYGMMLLGALLSKCRSVGRLYIFLCVSDVNAAFLRLLELRRRKLAVAVITGWMSLEVNDRVAVAP
jgi:hypothetical protein